MEYTFNSPAKINLFLHIVDKDDRGYHLIESYFALINLNDAITIEFAKCDNVICDQNIEDNIVYKTLDILRKNAKVNQGMQVTIKKNIPISAGLGGGSSNAATIISQMNHLLDLKLSQAEMISIGLKIGADVPFFICQKNAFVQGVGEKIKPLKLGINLPILLINPKIHSSTQDVFKNFRQQFSSKIKDKNKQVIIDNIFNGSNDLTNTAISIAPKIAELLYSISQQMGCKVYRMSGSGSTCFGIFDNQISAGKALNNLKLIYPNYWFYLDYLNI